MPETESQLNPYAPSAISEDASETRRWAQGLDPKGGAGDDAEAATASLSRTLVRWLVVCTVSAIPSFFFGMIVTESQVAAMAIGILVFVAGYTWLDYGTATRSWRRNRRMRRTLRITYGTRIAISILFPLGAYLDLICGVVTMTITGSQLNGPALDFVAALMTTLVQGCVLNVVLAFYGLLVYLIQVVVAAIRGRRGEIVNAA